MRTRTFTKKFPIVAGMPFDKTAGYQLQVVGYKWIKFTFRVYFDGDDSVLISEKEVKRVFLRDFANSVK